MTVIFWPKDSEEKDYYLSELTANSIEGIDCRFVLNEDEFQNEFDSSKVKALFIDKSIDNNEALESGKLIKTQFPSIMLYYLESEDLANEKMIDKQNQYKNVDGIIKKPLSIKFFAELCNDLSGI